MQQECKFLKYGMKKDRDGLLEAVSSCTHPKAEGLEMTCGMIGDWEECPLNELNEQR